MADTRDPDYLRQLILDVEAFRAAFEQWMTFHVPFGPTAGGLAPSVVLSEKVDPAKSREAADKVSRAAGRIAHVAQLTGALIMVQGLPNPIDPFVNWQAVARPKPVVEPTDVRGSCEYALGRLEGMVRETEAQQPPAVGVEQMHPLVWGAAGSLWRHGFRRLAVQAAAGAVTGTVKTRTGRSNDQDTAVLQQVFLNEDPKPGQPRLRWPGDPASQTVKSVRDGLARYAPGVNLLLRNTAAHSEGELGEQDALERLCAYSLLARLVDQCDLVQHDSEPLLPTETGSTSEPPG